MDTKLKCLGAKLLCSSYILSQFFDELLGENRLLKFANYIS